MKKHLINDSTKNIFEKNTSIKSFDSKKILLEYV